MKIVHIHLLLLTLISFASKASVVANEGVVIDQIKAVIHAPDETVVITQRDLARQSVTGKPQTLVDLIFEWLVFLASKALKAGSQEDAIEKYLTSIKEQNKLDDKQFEQMLANAGYTLEQFKSALERVQTANGMIDFKIRSHIAVPKEKIVAYYDANPITREASYQVERVVLPYKNKMTKAEQRRLIDKAIATNSTHLTNMEWQKPFWIYSSEIAESKSFIRTMQLEQYHVAEEQTGFGIYYLKNMKPEHVVPLEERIDEIVYILRQQLEKEHVDVYKKQLFDENTIIYFD